MKDFTERRMERQYRRALTWRRVMAAAGLVAAAWSGCQSAPPASIVPAEPLAPWSEADVEGASLSQRPCLDERGRRRGGDWPAEVLLSYVSTGREFRSPEGPDGYVLRIIPLDDRERARRISAEALVVLRREGTASAAPPAPPLRAWRIAAGRLEHYWMQSRLLPSYVLRLDWGDPPPERGNYRLGVYLTFRGQGGPEVICREIPFQEASSREAAATDRP